MGGDSLLYRIDANVFALSQDYLRILNNKFISFRDNQVYISSKDDGHLDLDADTSIDMNAKVDLGGNHIWYALMDVMQITSSARGTPQEGDLKWDSTAHKLQVYNGSAWETVTSA